MIANDGSTLIEVTYVQGGADLTQGELLVPADDMHCTFSYRNNVQPGVNAPAWASCASPRRSSVPAAPQPTKRTDDD